MPTIAEKIVNDYNEQKVGTQYYHEAIDMIRKESIEVKKGYEQCVVIYIMKDGSKIIDDFCALKAEPVSMPTIAQGIINYYNNSISEEVSYKYFPYLAMEVIKGICGYRQKTTIKYPHLLQTLYIFSDESNLLVDEKFSTVSILP